MYGYDIYVVNKCCETRRKAFEYAESHLCSVIILLNNCISWLYH